MGDSLDPLNAIPDVLLWRLKPIWNLIAYFWLILRYLLIEAIIEI